jgi:serine protease
LIITLRHPAALAPVTQIQAAGAALGVRLSQLRPLSGSSMSSSWDSAWAVPMPMRSRRLASHAAIASAEPDIRVQVQQIPNDPMYGQQWHYAEPAGGINLPSAWDATTGSSNVTIAVLDTGYRPHADLAPRLLPGYDFTSDPIMSNDGLGRHADALHPGDYGCATGNPNSSWHGTHVAGTLGAITNNSSGASGINWTSTVLPVRVTGKCGGYLSDVIDALRWAAGMSVTNVPTNTQPAQVANLSFSGESGS